MCYVGDIKCMFVRPIFDVGVQSLWTPNSVTNTFGHQYPSPTSDGYAPLKLDKFEIVPGHFYSPNAM